MWALAIDRRCAREVRSPLRRHRYARSLQKGPHLDRLEPARAHEAAREGDRLVQVPGLDDCVSAEVLPRLREGAVGEQSLALPIPDGRRGGSGLERCAAEELLLRAQLFHVGPAVRHQPLLLGRAELRPGIFVHVGEQHVFHRLVPPTQNRTAPRWIDTCRRKNYHPPWSTESTP